ncbi:MAG: hypothetical protein ACRC6X_08355 [Culicoidibacterales bacterium]
MDTSENHCRINRFSQFVYIAKEEYMEWKNIDADKADPSNKRILSELSNQLLLLHGLTGKSKNEVKKFVDDYLRDFNDKNLYSELNDTIAISVFRPHEFSQNTANERSLADLVDSINSFQYDWRLGSKTVQMQINSKYKSAGEKIIRGGRAKVILDSLVKILDKNVAIEYETSTNIDNGYFSLKQAIKDGKADYGVMIVPYYESRPGRANEALATDRLDRDCDRDLNAVGPIYRISIICNLDVYKELKKR